MANDISNAGCLLPTCWTWGNKRSNSSILLWTCLVTKSIGSRHWSNIRANTMRTSNPGNSTSRRRRYQRSSIPRPCQRSSRRLGRAMRWRRVRYRRSFHCLLRTAGLLFSPLRNCSYPCESDPPIELNNRASFIDFCQGLLNLNPIERWSPQQARMHPFITGEKFTKPFQVSHVPRAVVQNRVPPYRFSLAFLRRHLMPLDD